MSTSIYQNNALNAKSFFSSQLPKPDQTRHQYGGTVGFPSSTRSAVRVPQRRSDETRRRERRTRATSSCPRSCAAPRLTRGNDTPANRAFIESVLARYPSGAVPNDARSPRTYQTLFEIDQPDQDYSGRIDWNAGKSDTRLRPAAVHAPDPHVAGHHHWRAGEPEQQAAERGRDVDAHLLAAHARRVPLRPRHARHQRRHRGGQRHADHPLHRLTRLGGDHRQRRRVSDQSPSDRSSVRLQPVVGAGFELIRSSPAWTSAASISTIAPTTSRAASGRSTASASARPTTRRTRRCSTAACRTTSADTGRRSWRTG